MPVLIVLGVVLLVAAVLVRPHLFGPKPQHAGARHGAALTVAELRIRLAYEAGQRSVETGRHHLVTHHL
jgi:NADH:ubiquinone oxidoreductase subunit 3 (subunit A)